MPAAAVKRYWDWLPDACPCGAPGVANRLRKHSVAFGECRVWTATRNQKGYGRVRVDGRLMSAHRAAYETFIGPVAAGMELDHLCANRACIEPSHLEPVTHAENVRRGAAGQWLRAKTVCPAGHPYSGGNLYVGKRGERRCRECNRIASVRTNALRKERLNESRR